MSDKKEYILEGLCCANCAARIEEEVGALGEVSEVNLNLMNNKLSVGLNSADFDISSAVKRIVLAHEPSIKVMDLSVATEGNHKEQAHQEEAGVLKSYLIRLGAAVVITIIVSLLKLPTVISTSLLVLAYLLAGYEILWSAAKNIRRGQVFDENFLMGIASLGAFLIGESVEAIAVLVFYGIGELLQDLAVHRSKKNITGLMDIRPDYANLIEGGGNRIVSPEQVQVGNMILIKPGERVPLDGIVTKGNSFLDTRALTGESVPREVLPGDHVLSGTINTSGVIEVEVTKNFGEATVSKILELVQNAGSKKSQSEKFITKFARYYTPIVVYSAVAVAVLPPLLGFGTFADWLYRSLSFLIISCPCALVISIPLSFFGGIGGGAKQGVLIKGGNYLDALQQVDTVVFDKTGTLTKGVFKVVKVAPAEQVSSEELMRFAVIAENHSLHPIAKSIKAFYEKSNPGVVIEPAQITELAGHGVIAEYNGQTIYAGNDKLMRTNHIEIPEIAAIGSIVHVAVGSIYMGYLLIADEIKEGVRETITELKQFGVKRIVMLTGDHENVAKEIADLCGVDEYQAELLPQDKVSWFERLKSEVTGKGKIVFVGDGINDAPVLAQADIGIAMGGVGSDAAIEAADVVIMNDEISKIATAMKIARKTKAIVTQNIIFALGVKLLIMILAFFDITSIWFAIFADVGVALIALFNAMRAMRVRS
ncbi:MAG: heavy metal-transporting ATPase [Herbinix sp.]|jgi:Cd2+/Zn2+-exporting ATPase|nr:heavy metal-transporting ATPase [Herbinix sp.]